MTDQPAQLTWDVFVAPPKPTVTGNLAPGAQQRLWSPTSATLISGTHDAVLVDALLTVEEAHALAAWVAATGKNLTTIYVTHGHGDHFFGLGVLLQRFPAARALARPAVVEHMRQQMAPEFLASFWKARFPGQIPDRLVLADPLPNRRIDLEGHDLVAVDLGHTDTDNTTCLHVPSIDVVVAGHQRAERCPRPPVPRRVHACNSAGVDRCPRHHRVAPPTRGDRRTPARWSPRRPRDHRGDPPVHPRLRQNRRNDEHRAGAVRADARALPQSRQPGAFWISARALRP